MPPFRPPTARIDALATHVAAEIARAPGLTVKNPDKVRGIFRNQLAENLREGHAIEEEAMTMLRSHGQEIFAANADFPKMLADGIKILAKKKGFVL